VLITFFIKGPQGRSCRGAAASLNTALRQWLETASGWGMPAVWPYLNQTLFQIIDVAYALLIHPLNWVEVGIVRWLEIGRYKFWRGQTGADIRQWHVRDDTAPRCVLMDQLEVPWLPWQLLQLVLSCINIFMVNYKVLSHHKLCQVIAYSILIMFDFCESYDRGIMCVPGF